MPQTENVLVAYGFVIAPEDVSSGRFQWVGSNAFHSWTRLRQFKRSNPPEVVWEIVLDDREDEDPISSALFGAEHIPSWEVMRTGK